MRLIKIVNASASVAIGLLAFTALLFLAACGRSDPDTPPASTEPSATNPPIPTPIPTEPPLPWENYSPRPAGLIDALEAGVEDGSWSYEEGLISALQLLVGEVNLQSGAYTQAASLEGTGILHEAQRYLQSGESAQARAEIQRLLNRIAPAPENIQAYAIPEEAASLKVDGLAAPAREETECNGLWAEGFPPPKPGIEPVLCFKYLESNVGGSNLKVYYPITTLPKGFTQKYGDAAMEALVKAIDGYKSLQLKGKPIEMFNIQLVFTLLENTDPGTLASTPSPGGSKTCQIIVYPLSIAANEQESQKNGFPFGHFQQTIAHEAFHCVQVWNFPELADAPWGVQDWWAEGSAEYFGNVIYPQVNAEHAFIGDWAYGSATLPLTEMSYENFGFFQYLGNTIGNNAILALISTMPVTGGLDAQRAQLAKYDNIAILFDNYAREFVDGQIMDSSKAPLKTSPPYIASGYDLDVTGAATFHLGAPAFVLARHALTFKPPHLYVLNPTIGGVSGFDESRPEPSPGAWTDLPSQVPVGCQPVTYYYVLTSTTPSPDFFSVDLDIKVEKELGCDECLIGTWDLDVPSYVETLENLIPSTESDQFNVDFAGGLWQIEFTKQAVFSGRYNFATLYSFFQVNAPFGNNILTNVKLSIEGDISTLYTADGIGHLQVINLLQNNLNFDTVIVMNGDEIPTDDSQFAELFAPSASSDIVYSCDEDTLFLNYAPESVMGPLKYNRK